MEESDQKKKKAEKGYFYLLHDKLKKANLDQVFSKSRSGTIAHKNKKRITAVTQLEVELTWRNLPRLPSSTHPHPTNKSAPAILVKLTTGFQLLGHPVESPGFATEFFTSHINNVKECLVSMSNSITNEQTKLRLFSQCLLQKLPHFLASDILYNLPTDDPNPHWEQWNGPLTSAIEDIITTFLSTLLDLPSTPSYAILISQLSLCAGGLGILCPCSRAAPDFIITVTTAICNATTGFKLHKDLLPVQLHNSIKQLFKQTLTPNP
jgi:hypothetical protein